MIPEDFCQKNQYVIYLTSDDMIYIFEVFKKYNLDKLYLIEGIGSEHLQMLDEYWYEENTPY